MTENAAPAPVGRGTGHLSTPPQSRTLPCDRPPWDSMCQPHHPVGLLGSWRGMGGKEKEEEEKGEKEEEKKKERVEKEEKKEEGERKGREERGG